MGRVTLAEGKHNSKSVPQFCRLKKLDLISLFHNIQALGEVIQSNKIHMRKVYQS